MISIFPIVFVLLSLSLVYPFSVMKDRIDPPRSMIHSTAPTIRQSNTNLILYANDHDRETLLNISLRLNGPTDHAKLVEATQTFIRSFPFAAILPVQPLTYQAHNLGLSLLFLRKKTAEKDAIDGGIDFSIETLGTDADKLSVVAKRNPTGQTLNKVFSEKLIIEAFVKSIYENRIFTVVSVFHKWL